MKTITKYYRLQIYSYNLQRNGTIHTDFRHGVETAELDRLYDKVRQAVTTEIEDGDAVYFHSTSLIPRYKFSKFCEGSKTRRVLSVDKASACVINISKLDKQSFLGYHHNTHYRILPETFPSMIMGVAVATPPPSVTHPLTWIMDLEGYNQLAKVAQVPPAHTFPSVEITEQYLHNGEIEKYYQVLQELEQIVDSGKKIVLDKTLNKQMGESSYVVSQENYDDLYRMLNSENQKDFTLGMEMVANSNYIESKFYVSLLLNACYERIQQMGSKWGVNVKNMLQYFEEVAYNQRMEVFITALRKQLLKDGTLNDEQEKVLRDMMLRYLNERLFDKNGIEVQSFVWK